jgi:AcrR family transcriptional regulator
MRKVANRIDHSPTAIYLHFKDKSDLLRSICDETFLKLSKALETITERMESGKCDVIEGLKRGLHVYVEFGLSHPRHYELTFLTRREIAGAEEMSTGLHAFSYLTRGVQACVNAGRLRDKRVDEMSQALWAGIHGVTALLIQQPDFPFVARKKLIKRVIDSMVDGLSE